MTGTNRFRPGSLATAIALLLVASAARASEPFVSEPDARRLASVTFLRFVAARSPLLQDLELARLGAPALLEDPASGPLFWEFPAERDGEVVGRLLIPADRRVGTTDLVVERCSACVPWPQAFERAVQSLQREYGGVEVLAVRPLMYAYPDSAVEVHFVTGGNDRPMTALIDRATAEMVDPGRVRPFFAGLSPEDLSQRMCKWEDEDGLAVDYQVALSEQAVDPSALFERPVEPAEQEIAADFASAVYGPNLLKKVDLSQAVLVPAEASHRSREATLQMVYAEDHGWGLPYAPRSQQQIEQELTWSYNDLADPKGALKDYLRAPLWGFAKSDYLTASVANLEAEIDAGRLFIELVDPRRARMVVAYWTTAAGVSTGYYDPLPSGYGKIGFEKTYVGTTALVPLDSYLTVKK